MSGIRIARNVLRTRLALVAVVVTGALAFDSPALALVKIFDGFGDADRDNNGVIEFYDTDINDSGTWNDEVEDLSLSDRGIIEVTAAQNPADTGIVWSGTRSYDTTPANIPKSRLRIINDSVATGSETSTEIHNDGLALGVESRGGGSSFIGRFAQSVEVGPVAGDKLVVSVDFRAWKEADLAFTPPDFNELRWGLFEDTDNEFGSMATYGSGTVSAPPGQLVEWGQDDGNWFASQPGAEGDKGIRTQLSFGSLAAAGDSRIQWEYNLININGTTNNARILEGTGVNATSGLGGDTGTIASPLTAGGVEGPGGIIHNGTYAPHKLSIEIVRLADGLIEVASFVDATEILRDEIKTTDTGYSVLGPPPFSYDYVAFRNSADFDYVIDNFQLEIFGSNAAGLQGDFNDDGYVDATDYTVWRNNLGAPDDGGPLNGNGDGGAVGPSDYSLWKLHYGEGMPPGAGGGGAAINAPEPSTLALLLGIECACGLWPSRRRK